GLAAAALGAGVEVQQVFPIKIPQGLDAQHLGVFHVQRLQAPLRLQVPCKDAGRGGEEVHHLAEGDVADEHVRHQQVEPPEEPVDRQLRPVLTDPQRDQGTAGGQPDGAPRPPRVVGGHDAQALYQETGREDGQQGREQKPVLPQPVGEPGHLNHVAAVQRDDQTDDGAQAEDVQDQRLENEVEPAVHDGGLQVGLDEDDRRAYEEDDEAPGYQDVKQAGLRVSTAQLLLADGVGEEAPQSFP